MLDGLNEFQKAAVLTGDGPLLVVAGPGTGKTRTLTHRIAYLINEKSIPPDKVLAITFTRKAAHEMKGRLKGLLGGDTGNVTIDTIHSLCLRILRKNIYHLGMRMDFSVVPRRDRLQDDEIAEGNLLDFDDLISFTVELLERQHTLLTEYRKRYPYIFVDEYQDIDLSQRHLITLLSGESGNMCAIGDPDQAIYSFRGANVENFLLFEKEYEGARVITFRHNYRSTPIIVSASNEVIKKNRRRIDKPIEAIKAGGDRLQVYAVPDEGYEGRLIVKEIEGFIGAMNHYSLYTRGESASFPDKGYKFSDFAVLSRLNAQISRVEEAFKDSGMPYQVVGGKGSVSEEEVRAALSYLHIIDNPEGDEHILQVLNIPNRSLGPKAITEIREKARGLSINIYEMISKYRDKLSLNKIQREGLRDFVEMIEKLCKESEGATISNLVRRVLKDTGIEALYEDGKGFSDLISISVQYDDYPRELALRSFLDDIALSSDIDYYDERADAVTLMTIHASKGLEFRVVFVCGVEDGLIPYSLSSDQIDLEEERRLFYVGMTRATERLYLINAEERYLFGKKRTFPPSPFLSDIPGNLMEMHTIGRTIPKKGSSPQLSLFPP